MLALRSVRLYGFAIFRICTLLFYVGCELFHSHTIITKNSDGDYMIVNESIKAEGSLKHIRVYSLRYASTA